MRTGRADGKPYRQGSKQNSGRIVGVRRGNAGKEGKWEMKLGYMFLLISQAATLMLLILEKLDKRK